MSNTQSISVNPQDIRDQVRQGYSEVALSRTKSCCGPSSSCSGSNPDFSNQLVQVIGYQTEDLETLPEGANLGLSCGNPIALASLKQGEVVVDLGSGGGFDIFIAGRKVGADGRVIGVDMTPEMISRARRNIPYYQKLTGLNNVEFRLGEIEHLPVADHSADAVISNCVLNLSPEKEQVWTEIYRVLRPGGRVSVADPALVKPLPPAIKEMVEALVGCIAGAVLIEDTRKMMEAAGFVNIQLESRPDYADALTDSHDPLYTKMMGCLSPGETINDYMTTLLISAQKPV